VRKTRVQEEKHSLLMTATSRSKQSRKQRRRQKAVNYGLASGEDAASKVLTKKGGKDASFFISPSNASAKKIVPTAEGGGKAAGGEEGVVFANDREQLLALKIITVRDCTFTYPSLRSTDTHDKSESAAVVKALNLDVPLGNLVWLATPEGAQGTGIGRLTLMKLLAGLLVPTAGTVTVPAHLKVRGVQLILRIHYTHYTHYTHYILGAHDTAHYTHYTHYILGAHGTAHTILTILTTY
jgi:ATPase subunit of ABC transporter with duplicated ATPase domains